MKKKTEVVPEKAISVIADDSVQNKAFAEYIQRVIEIPCSLIQSIEGYLTDRSISATGRSMVLVDCSFVDADELLKNPYPLHNLSGQGVVVVFYNMHQNSGLEVRALSRGVAGFFYTNQPVASFLKGIQAIFSGEVWISRSILLDAVKKSKNSNAEDRRTLHVDLTPRETEILAMISQGATNDEIADSLCVSLSTVKTHLYNIYKKINVPNRVQAALWCAQNL